jgi:glycosyltransferase involved in cell wall biosynthesis
MMNKPTVSVVIPTYNRSNQVKKAIESVLYQTYKDYEIIVVDDGSIDNTKQIIDEPALRVKWRKNALERARQDFSVEVSRAKFLAVLGKQSE